MLVYFRLPFLVREGELESIFTHSVSISSVMDGYGRMIAVYIKQSKIKKHRVLVKMETNGGIEVV